MRRDDDDATRLREVAQEAEHAVDLDVVEVRGRLVGEHQRRVVCERPRDRDPLLLTARQVGRTVVSSGPRARPARAALRRAPWRLACGTLPDCAAIWTFSRAVRLGIRLNAWKTMPTVLRR